MKQLTLIIMLASAAFGQEPINNDLKIKKLEAQIVTLQARIKQLQLQVVIYQDPNVMKVALEVIAAENKENALSQQSTAKIPGVEGVPAK